MDAYQSMKALCRPLSLDTVYLVLRTGSFADERQVQCATTTGWCVGKMFVVLDICNLDQLFGSEVTLSFSLIVSEQKYLFQIPTCVLYFSYYTYELFII